MTDETYAIYQDDAGFVYFVGDGISMGTSWMTLKTKDRISTHRVKSPYLPVRKTRGEAQHDLDAWAKAHALRLHGSMDGPE